MGRRGKKQINVWLSEDGYYGWLHLMNLWRVDSMTAVVEAVGQAVARGDLPKHNMEWDRIAAAAIEVSATRRSRLPPGATG